MKRIVRWILLSVWYKGKAYDAEGHRLWRRSRRLGGPLRTAFGNFAVHATLLLEDLTDKHTTQEKPVDVNFSEMDALAVRRLFALILCFFCYLLTLSNKPMRREIEDALKELTELPDYVHQLFQSFDIHYVKSRAEVGIGTLCGKVWDEFRDIAGVNNNSCEAFIFFAALLTRHYKDASVCIQQGNETLSGTFSQITRSPHTG